MKRNLKKVVLGTAGVALLSGITFALTAPNASAATANTASIYRLYNPNTGEHFYTESAAEKAADVTAGWSYEGIGWNAPTTGTAVYRVYNPNAKGGDHYYTKSKFEAQQLVKLGWKWDNNAKPVFYSGGSTPIYVAYNPNAQSGAHNYTGNAYEENSLISAGWKYKAVAWNAVSVPVPAPAPAPTNSALQTLANEMNSEAPSMLQDMGGTYSGFKATTQGTNTLIMTFTFAQNMGSLTTAETQQFKSEMSSLVTPMLTQMKQVGISNPSIKIVFKNPNGTIAVSIVYP